jgi:cysteine desulfurase/selenocysteine lyase
MLPEKIREDFPILEKQKNLIYLNNAATTLKPKSVIEAMNKYYTEIGANLGRGAHRLSRQATTDVDTIRKETAKFINANDGEIIFTRNTTDSINIVATSLERAGKIKSGDEIAITFAEHHANLIPWQKICERQGAKLKIIKINNDFTLDLEDLNSKITKKTKIVAMTHIPNTIGSIFPVKEAAKLSHENGALFLLDAAQSTPHTKIDIKKIGADFAAFSGHKMLGPTGIGCLYMKKDLIEQLPPATFGGGAIKSVSFEKTIFSDNAEKFEPGTMPIAEIYGLGEAIKYIKKVGIENIEDHEKELLKTAFNEMEKIEGIKFKCPKNPEKQAGIILFDIEGLDTLDIGVALDESKNIAIRTGFHCAEPIVRSINPKGLARASFYIYNTKSEIETFANELNKICTTFR